MRLGRLAAILTLLACPVACDEGEAPLALGSRPRLSERRPEDGAGLDCDAREGSCGVAANQPLSFTFDRWLLPSTATRQSLTLWADGAGYAAFVTPQYELLTRTVSYHVVGDLEPGLVYVLALNEADRHELGWGFQSYDRLPLDREDLRDPIAFRAGARSGDAEPEAASRTACREALEALKNLGCTDCHAGAPERSLGGLSLDSRDGLANALGRVARSTNHSGEDGDVAVSPARFGMNMALIHAGEPAYSFLVYRLLLRRDTYRDKDGHFASEPLSDSEARFAEKWFGASGPMPPVDTPFAPRVSPVRETRVLERWIRDGAETAACE